jgi:hypothetical protein
VAREIYDVKISGVKIRGLHPPRQEQTVSSNVTPTRPPATRPRTALYAGLALTVAATLVPLVDLVTADTLTDHVRSAYPSWSADLVAKDRNAIVGYLAAVGVLGAACWLWAIRSVGRRSMRRTVTVLFAVGACTLLFDLSYSGGAYDRIIPALYGVTGLLPALAGAVAVVQVWRPGARPAGSVTESSPAPSAGGMRP